MGEKTDPRETNRRMPRNRLAGAGTGGRGAADVFGDIARGYAFGKVAASTRKTYEANWKLWVSWRSFVGKGSWLQKELGEMELVAELTEFMGYCCAEKGNKETTIAGKLVAINFYHEQFVGLSLPLGNPLIRSVKQGIKRAHVEKGSQQRVRRPLTWGILTRMQESVPSWGVGGRVVWIGLALSYFLMLRASELFAGEKGEFHSIYCLRRGDVAFFRNNEQLGEGRRQEADKVEVRFRGSKGDQGRKGAVIVRTRGEGGGAVGLLVELFSMYSSGELKGEAPLMAFRGEEGWRVWSRGQATQCLRSGIADVGGKWRVEGRGAGARLIPEEFALHSGRIGGATRLAAKRVPEAVIKKEGRWSSDAFMVYVRANMEDPVWVSEVLGGGAGEYERQPGQGTRWG